MQQNLCRLIAAVVVSLLAAFGCLKANAQTADSLRQQYESTCTEELYKLSSDMRTTCDSMRSTIEQLEKLQASKRSDMSANAPPPRLAQGELGSRDGTDQCNCTRSLGRCNASASVLSQKVTDHGYGRSSRVVVTVEPPRNQCVEVTAFLQETATINGVKKRIGHPIHQVISAVTDTEWKNLSTPATALDYAIASGSTECYICAPKNAKGKAAADAAEAKASAREDIRRGMETAYQQCLQGKLGGDVKHADIDPTTLGPICAKMREEIDAGRY